LPDVLTVLVIINLILTAGLAALVFTLHHAAIKNLGESLQKLGQQTNEGLNTAPKLLEVREFYQYASEEIQRLLNEAHREGDRAKQDRFRRLLERLNTLKARTLDRTAKILDPSEDENRRRRHSRRPFRPRNRQHKDGGDHPSGNNPSGPSQPPNPGPNA